MESTHRGAVLPVELAAEFVRQVADLQADQKQVVVTGGGEPLEYPHLVELANMLLATNLDHLELVTSGCKDENERGFDNLKALSEIPDGRWDPTLSAMYLHPRLSARRLGFTIPYLEKMSPYLFVKYTDDFRREPDKSLAVLNQLGRVFLALGYCYGVEDLPEAERSKLNEEQLAKLDKDWQEKYILLKSPVVTLPGEWGDLSCERLLQIGFQQVLYDGRAKQFLSMPPVMEGESRGICPSLQNPERERLVVDASGNIFPCSCEYWPTQMVLGNIADMTLTEALVAKVAKLEWAKQNFLANPFDMTTWHQCHRCYTTT